MAEVIAAYNWGYSTLLSLSKLLMAAIRECSPRMVYGTLGIRTRT